MTSDAASGPTPDAKDAVADHDSLPNVEDLIMLTDLERKRAKDIKAVVQQEDEALAKELSDLEYAQLAIVTKEKFGRALLMVRKLSQFKRNHGISYSQD